MAEPKTTHFYKYIHVALRQDIAGILADAIAVGSAADAAKLATRVARLGHMARLHVAGEEKAIFTALARYEPGSDATYLFDHKEEHTLIGDVEKLARRIADGDASAEAKTELVKKATVLDAHFSLHMRKENSLALPTLLRHSAAFEDERAALVGMLSVYGTDDVAVLVPWMLGWLKPEDRALCVGELSEMLPEVIAEVKPRLKGAIPPEIWADVAAKVPALAS